MKKRFDCIVIGAGHAGAEAAYAAAKIGAETALLTISKDSIAQMSCNPAVGGLAKGQIVREIDALGGLMGLAIDAAGIQFRILNRSRGHAVQAPRAQADRHRYARWVREVLEETERLVIIEAMVTNIIVAGRKVRAVACADGAVYQAETVILTVGTFLSGRLFQGEKNWPGGRINEPAAEQLGCCIRKLGLKTGRMSTDTTPRLYAETVDFDRLEVQAGDEPAVPFSFMTEKIDNRQVPCWITQTNEKIHQLLRDNLGRAPLASGQIKGAEPRYCPSIEAKVVRFKEKKSHRIFLEPEESSIETIYCNGFFTSMPADVQQQVLMLMPGTERAKIKVYSYAVEYDYCLPAQLKAGLETKKIDGLFLAGQINGTSGYEEAAGQGVIAGINAAGKLRSAEPVVLGRDQAYIGVLLDDLLTRQIDEPYRMFTSRAEYRLSLRSDNADRRLTHVGRTVGLVDGGRWKKFQDKLSAIAELEKYLKNKKSAGVTAWQLLGRPDNTLADKLAKDEFVEAKGFGEEVTRAVVIDAKYEGYLKKQERLAGAMQSLDSKRIPAALDYNVIEHLRAEAKEKLSHFTPETLGRASRISGITPADITVIRIHLKKYH